MEDKKINFLFFIILTILAFCIMILEFLTTYKEINNEKYYKIGYCEGKGGEIVEGKCVDKKYILEIKK